MTIKELFKMVETSNQVANYCSNDKVALYIIDNEWCELGTFKTYEQFKKFAKDNYFNEYANQLLKMNFEDNGTLSFSCYEVKGISYTSTFNFSIEFITI